MVFEIRSHIKLRLIKLMPTQLWGYSGQERSPKIDAELSSCSVGGILKSILRHLLP